MYAAVILAGLTLACASASGELYVPDVMVAGLSYEGILVLDEPPQDATAVLLASTGPFELDGSVTVPAGGNHGIFSIHPNSSASGRHAIRAIFGDGRTVEAETTVFPSTGTPSRLDIVSVGGDAVHTGATIIPLHVFVTDARGEPAPVQNHTRVTLTSTAVRFPALPYAELSIPAGQYHTKTQARVVSSGMVDAAADGLEPDRLDVRHLGGQAAVRLEVAPNPLPVGKLGYYYAWIERGGALYRPAGIPDVYLESDRLGFGHGGGPYHDHLYDGVARGLVRADVAGNATISASIPGYGSATITVEVPAASEYGQAQLHLSVHPAKPDRRGWAVLSYGANSSVPPPSDVRLVSDRQMLLERPDDPRGRHAGLEIPILFEEAGTHNITAVSGGLRSGVLVDVIPSVYAVSITPLPSRSGDLALAAITLDGYHIELDAASPSVTHADGIQDLGISDWSHGISTITGTLGWTSTIFVQAPGLESKPATLEPPASQTGIRIWTPPRVHSFEEFPAVVHEMAGNTPTGHAQFALNSHGMERARESPLRLVALSDGVLGMGAVSRGHADNATVESFSNALPFGVSAPRDVVRLGERLVLYVDTGPVPDPDIVVSGLEFEREGDAYVAVPDAGVYQVRVSASKDGWTAGSGTLTLAVEDLVSVRFFAVADDGVSVPAGLVLDGPKDRLALRQGSEYAIRPGSYHVEPDMAADISDRSYRLDGMLVDGEAVTPAPRFLMKISESSNITSVYERRINISYEAVGDADPAVLGGTYGYGERVTVHARPVPELLGLVWLTPKHWEGLPDSADLSADATTASLLATADAAGYVEYERDYTVLTVLIGILATASAAWLCRPRLITILSRVSVRGPFGRRS